MSWIALGDPSPREEVQRFNEPAWPEGRRTVFPATTGRANRPFDQVALRRRTRYELKPPSLEDVGALFSLTSRVQHSSKESGLGFPLTRRPLPSAGAIHPIHIIVHRVSSPSWERYDPFDHTLVEICSSVSPTNVRSVLDRIVPTAETTVFIFAAEPQRTAAKYLNESSLVWRDAGVLIGGMALASEALDLSFVPLGITAEPWVAALVPNRPLAGVGGALLGAYGSR